MKKNALLLLLCLAGMAVNAQQPKWLLGSLYFNGSSSPPALSSSGLTGVTSLASSLSNNAAYDASGNPLFTCTRGNINTSNSGAVYISDNEISVIKVGACDMWYVIGVQKHTTGTSVNYNLHHAIIQMSGGSANLLGNVIDDGIIGDGDCGTPGIAVSKLTATGERYLYTVGRNLQYSLGQSGSSFVKKFIISPISPFANFSASDISISTSMLFPSSYHGGGMEELELYQAANGSAKLAWGDAANCAGGGLHLFSIDLSSLTSTTGIIRYYAVPSGTNRVSGLEFYNSGRNLVYSVSGGSAMGINTIDIDNSSPAFGNTTYVPFSSAYQYSKIEKDAAGNYYAALQITCLQPGCVNMTGITPINVMTSALGSTTPFGTYYLANPNYDANFPDQVDDENYYAVPGTPVKSELMAHDGVFDSGIEPNPSADVWTSPDLWNRRDNNGNQNDSQEPGYGGGSNLMKIRIKNIGCAASASSFVRLYWTLGKTGEHWPASWDGTEKLGTPAIPAGAEIKSNDPNYNLWTNNGYVIDPLAPGAETVIRAKWIAPNPAAYNDADIKEGSMICFLGRIDDPAYEPMYSELSSATASTGHNIGFNNNIVTRNSNLVNLSGAFKVVPGGGILVNNYLPERAVFNVRFRALTANDVKFGEIGRIKLKLGERLWNAWIEGGRVAEGLEISSYEAHEVTVIDLKSIVLKNIAIQPQEHMGISVSFELTTNTDLKEAYNFAFSQEKAKRKDDDEAYGSECVFTVTVNGEEKANEGGTIERQSTALNSQVADSKKDVQSVLFLYPNPSDDKVTVQFVSDLKESSVNILITDMSGKIIRQLTQKAYSKSGQLTVMINTKDLKNGTYILSVQDACGKHAAILNIAH